MKHSPVQQVQEVQGGGRVQVRVDPGCRFPSLVSSARSAARCIAMAALASQGLLPSSTRSSLHIARLPGVSEPSSPSRPSARAPTRGALEQTAGRHPGREPPHGLQLREEIQVLDAGKTIGPDRHRHADAIEPLDRRHARHRPTGCCAGRSRVSRPGRDPGQALVRELHSVHDQRSLVDHTEASGYSTGPVPAASQSSRQAPIQRSIRSHSPVPRASSSISSGDSATCTLVHGSSLADDGATHRAETTRARPSTVRAAPAIPGPGTARSRAVARRPRSVRSARRRSP